MKIETLSMDEVEQMFVEAFFTNEKRSRALYELTSKKKRREFFAGLRGGDPRLKMECVHDVPVCSPSKEVDEILGLLRSRGAEETCYLMSYIREIDRQFLLLEEGLLDCLNCPMEVVLVCGSNLAFIQGERMSASPPRSILQCPKKKV